MYIVRSQLINNKYENTLIDLHFKTNFAKITSKIN